MKISNILPDQSLFEQDIKSPTTDSDEFFETISQALAILTSDIAKDMISKNIKELYQDKKSAAQLTLHFESIYTLLGDSQFITALKTSFKKVEERLGDGKIISKFKRQLHSMRMDLCALFKKYTIPYLSDQSVDKLNAIQGLFIYMNIYYMFVYASIDFSDEGYLVNFHVFIVQIQAVECDCQYTLFINCC